MINLGLLGKNISHSKSPQLYKELLQTPVNYYLFDYDDVGEIPSLKQLFKESKLTGLNITAPYKTHYLNHVDKILGPTKSSINCIFKIENEFIATNTDYIALAQLLPRYFFSLENIEMTIVLGSGAMTKLITHLLELWKIPYHNVFRGQGKNWESQVPTDKKIFLINCISREYVFYRNIAHGSVFWDLNYAHGKQKKIINDQNAQYIDGLELLYLQAQHTINFWNL
ncbi:MAG: hypothetical protein ACOCUH_02210 [Bacteriovoracia bacterium]